MVMYAFHICPVFLDGVNMMSGTSMAAHIMLPHANIEAHTQDPFFEFHSITVRAYRLLWSLTTVHPWMEFRLCYHPYMVIGNPGWDGPGFQT